MRSLTEQVSGKTLGSANTRGSVSMPNRVNEAIQTHYSRPELGSVILAALEEAGKDLASLLFYPNVEGKRVVPAKTRKGR